MEQPALPVRTSFILKGPECFSCPSEGFHKCPAHWRSILERIQAGCALNPALQGQKPHTHDSLQVTKTVMNRGSHIREVTCAWRGLDRSCSLSGSLLVSLRARLSLISYCQHWHTPYICLRHDHGGWEGRRATAVSYKAGQVLLCGLSFSEGGGSALQ